MRRGSLFSVREGILPLTSHLLGYALSRVKEEGRIPSASERASERERYAARFTV